MKHLVKLLLGQSVSQQRAELLGMTHGFAAKRESKSSKSDMTHFAIVPPPPSAMAVCSLLVRVGFFVCVSSKLTKCCLVVTVV